MRAPGFWRRGFPSPLARALAPLGAVYGAAAGARLARPAPRAELPVIVVGGLTLGGDGKTPTALALAALLRELGEAPAFSTRGYGGAAGRPPFRVDPERHTAAEAGDEALLLARSAPTFAGVDRLAAARVAQAAGASVLILDDGLHSRRIDADLALVVVDAGHGAGNGLCPPAGPLRAPLLRQLAIVDAVVVIGAGAAGDAIAALARSSGKPVFRAAVRPDPEAARRLAGAPVLAFAGIARPEKFFATLEETGARLVGRRAFPDHHRFSRRDLFALDRQARTLGARLVTTEKDAARCPGVGSVLPIVIRFQQEEALRAALAGALTAAA
ncbi:tetraacyldisaccharide 4'-kinase [Methylosinus trichosporium]|uniref:Tetraacyldisaccharide 4'-kinase n=1 Tax=Methylosinus trichosporium (strain ATCC 35070 / NCIMB 11131 / UNIQEM 75 / OB3b) TaxID=595536 RepID=A0A2D2D662_METT3|nr:tetraacyldisaccharide 4'-kinase [Methylosinus trichosporium OB3b]OBS51966.1 tetraacyldisaccharide 4'-kinase [Methylosinus sp. 3S-1]